MPVKEATLAKPLLVSQDYFILDGNRRWRTHIESQSSQAPCFVLGLDLIDALKFLHAYPKVYRYADGPQPERV